MHSGLATLFLAALFVLAVLAVDLQDAYNARSHPLTGEWAAEFVMDSGTPRARDSLWRPQPGAQASGVVRLRVGAPDWLGRSDRLWRAAFIGTHSLDFAPLLGYAASPRDALGLRLGADSVRLYLNGYCCHTGGVGARGRIAGDSVITGRWATDSDGWAAWGWFVLRRAPAAHQLRQPNVRWRLVGISTAMKPLLALGWRTSPDTRTDGATGIML